MPESINGFVTAAHVMDRSAVLLNDPIKTDYTHDVLLPFLKMAVDELGEYLIDSQNSLMLLSPGMVPLMIGESVIHPKINGIEPSYPVELVEVQEIGERLLGSEDPFTPLIRTDFVKVFPAGEKLGYWSWETNWIRFNPNGATTNRQILLKILRRALAEDITPDTGLSGIMYRSFLSYKTAAFAAMFIGENSERAKVLSDQAEQSLERMESIDNKGRQQIMTRHRPFRAAYKTRGGF